jgi:hypothetical protein
LKPAATINDKHEGVKLSSALFLLEDGCVGDELFCKAIVFAIEAFEFISKHVDINVLYILLSIRFRFSFDSFEIFIILKIKINSLKINFRLN